MTDAGPRVTMVVCGGIAAYKAAEVLRGLQKAGCEVRVVMTADAERFVGPTTFYALTHHEVTTSLYGNAWSDIPHIALAEFADLMLVVPATANIMAKMAHGIADDAASSTLLVASSKVLVAPAMNTHMWQNAATQENLHILQGQGVGFVMPASGTLACGSTGEGKLAPVDEIVGAALSCLGAGGSLAGRRVVITAGPTHEAIDAVRYIANASSGKMGYAIAREAAARGANVTLVSGPTSLATPVGVTRKDVVSAAQMFDATTLAFNDADVAICAAAVADYTPAHPADVKLKKSVAPLSSIELVETRDILATLCKEKGARKVVGFAAETDNLLAYAAEKREKKGCDLVIANDVSRRDSTFGSDTSRIAFVWPDRVEQMDTLPLSRVAVEIMDRVELLLSNGDGPWASS